MPRTKGSKNGVRNLVELKCKRCDKLFKVEPWENKRNRQYCSNDCKKQYGSAKLRREAFKSQRLCIDCGKPPIDGTTRCNKCTKKSRLRNNKWHRKNKQVLLIREKQKRLDPMYCEKRNLVRRQLAKKFRFQILDLYGGECVCCGEKTKDFLQFDHTNKDGKKHRAAIGGNGLRLIYALEKNFYSKEYDIRVLCANCHFAITSYGKCPHEKSIQISTNDAFAK